MIPILYEETEIEFKTNGIGRLADAISCTVTEERNGEYELEMEYPESGKLFKELKHSRIIGAVPSEDASIQGFRIYKISKPISGTVTVSAEHISYQLSHIPTLLPGTVVTSAQSALQLLSDNAMVSNPFSFTTDVTAAGSFSADGLYSIRGILAGTAGSVLQAFGGEYEFDNWRVILHSARGTKTDVVLDYGKNITDFKQEENIENTSTSVVAYWENSSSDSGVTRVVGDIQNSDNVNRFPYNRPLLLDCSQDYKDAPTKDQLNAKAQSYIKANNIGVPSVSIDVSFVALWQTEEYKDIAPLEKVHLCDTLTVRFSKLGVETTAKVIKTEYNVLMDRYNEISIGDTKYTLADTILNINDEIKQTSDKMATDMQNAIDHATRLINGGLGGYVVITPNETTGYPEEILIMDTPSKQTAKNVIRLNKNGIGFSLGNGYDGPFQSAWTIDGAFNANWITTGVLRAGLIKAGVLSDKAGNFYLDTESGNLRMKNGTFEGSVTGSTITGSTITGSMLQTADFGKNFWNLLTGEFFLGNLSSTYIERGGDGNMTGAFGGWEVGDKYIQSKALRNGTRFYLDSYNGQLYIGSGWGRRRETVLTDEEVRGKYMIINSSVTDLNHSPCFESITDDEGHKLLDMCAYSERGKGGDKHKYVFLDYGCLAGNFSRDGNGHGLGFYALTDWCEAVQRKFIDSGLGELDLRRMHDLN